MVFCLVSVAPAVVPAAGSYYCRYASNDTARIVIRKCSEIGRTGLDFPLQSQLKSHRREFLRSLRAFVEGMVAE